MLILAMTEIITGKNMLDQDVINLAKAIRQHETGNRPVRGATGEMASRYQFLPSTWASSAKKYLGNSKAPLTLENENKVAYSKIKEWKDAGYNPGQIASLWNSGNPDMYAKGNKGVGKSSANPNVTFNVPKYVNSVYSIYLKNKAENPPIKPIKPIPTTSNAPAPATGNENIPEALSKQATNLPQDIGNFAKGLWDTVNPVNTVKNIGDIASGVKEMATGQLNPLDVVAEVPDTLLNAIVPESWQQAIGGLADLASSYIPFFNDKTRENLRNMGDEKIQQAQKTMIEKPFSQPAQGVLSAELLTKGVTGVPVKSELVNKTADFIKKPIDKIGDLTKSTAEYGVSQTTAMSPSTISEIIKNPSRFEKYAMESTNRSSLAEIVWEDISKKLNDFSETGKGYEPIRSSPGLVKIPENAIFDFIKSKYKVDILDGKIITNRESIPMSAGDKSSLQNFIDTYGGGGEYSNNAFLNARKALSDMSKYEASKTDSSAIMARGLREFFDSYGKSQIKGLKELDNSYSKQVKELKQLKSDLIIKDKTTGEYRFKDNAMSRISNASNANNVEFLKRLENIRPGITKEIRILRAIEDIERAGGQKVGAYARGLVGGGGGFIVGGPIGAIMGYLLTNPSTVVPILRYYGRIMGLKTEIIEGITKKLGDGKKLTPSEIEILYDAIKLTAAMMPKK